MQFACYAWRLGDQEWEAICTDLDIAAQGISLDEAKRELEAAVSAYVEYVLTLPEEEVSEFLNRKSPLGLRLRLGMLYRWWALVRLLNATPRFAKPWVVDMPAQ